MLSLVRKSSFRKGFMKPATVCWGGCHLIEERGSRSRFRSSDQYRVLMSACASTQETESHVLDCVNQLIKRGADINSFDRWHSLT